MWSLILGFIISIIITTIGFVLIYLWNVIPYAHLTPISSPHHPFLLLLWWCIQSHPPTPTSLSKVPPHWGIPAFMGPRVSSPIGTWQLHICWSHGSLHACSQAVRLDPGNSSCLVLFLSTWATNPFSSFSLLSTSSTGDSMISSMLSCKQAAVDFWRQSLPRYCVPHHLTKRRLNLFLHTVWWSKLILPVYKLQNHEACKLPGKPCWKHNTVFKTYLAYRLYFCLAWITIIIKFMFTSSKRI